MMYNRTLYRPYVCVHRRTCANINASMNYGIVTIDRCDVVTLALVKMGGLVRDVTFSPPQKTDILIRTLESVRHSMRIGGQNIAGDRRHARVQGRIVLT